MAKRQSRAQIEQLETLQGKNPVIAYVLNIPLPGLGNCFYGRPVMGVFLMMIVFLAVVLFFAGGLAWLIGIILIIVSIIGAFFTLGLSLLLLPLGLLMLVLGAGPLLSVIMYLFCLIVSELLVATKVGQVEALGDLKQHPSDRSFADPAYLELTVQRVEAIFKPSAARIPNMLLWASAFAIAVVAAVVYVGADPRRIHAIWDWVDSIRINESESDRRAPSETSDLASDENVSPEGRTPRRDIIFRRPTFSLNQAHEFDVFNLRLGMSVEQAKHSLTNIGFAPPEGYRHGVDRQTGIGFDFDCGYGRRCAYEAGRIQSHIVTSEWTRGQVRRNKHEETIFPQFYIDENGQQRLARVWYHRYYDPAIFPGNVAEQMIERFGEPTLRASQESGEVLSFYIQVPVPEAYTRTTVDARVENGSEAWFRDSDENAYRQQRAVLMDRLKCWEADVASFPNERSEACSKLLAGPATEQRIFDALSRFRENEFLRVQVEPLELRISLRGDFLAQAAAISAEERKLAAQLAELKRRRVMDTPEIGDL